MRARRERAVAHTMAKNLAAVAKDMGRVDVEIWCRRIEEFTKPRPWWRFW